MLKQTLISSLLWMLACMSVSVSGQEPGLGDPMRPYATTPTPTVSSTIDAEPALRLRVTGVLVSSSGRVAIVNDTLTHEGDRIDGAQIVAIEPATVHLRIGSRELTAHVGSDVLIERQAREIPLERPAQHAVQRGETLSGIAQHHRRDGVTLDQMMIALFDANPGAFGGNINVLRAGATLRIPAADELARHAPVVAAAEVERQTREWRGTFAPRPALAAAPQHPSYGPVGNGETLSEIAAALASDGATLNQVMIALFESNTEAFGGNINVLYAGVHLRIPAGEALRRQAPAAASAEVVRQTDEWRSGFSRQAAPAAAPAGDAAGSPLIASAR